MLFSSNFKQKEVNVFYKRKMAQKRSLVKEDNVVLNKKN